MAEVLANTPATRTENFPTDVIRSLENELQGIRTQVMKLASERAANRQQGQQVFNVEQEDIDVSLPEVLSAEALRRGSVQEVLRPTLDVLATVGREIMAVRHELECAEQKNADVGSTQIEPHLAKILNILIAAFESNRCDQAIVRKNYAPLVAINDMWKKNRQNLRVGLGLWIERIVKDDIGSQGDFFGVFWKLKPEDLC